MHHCMWDTAHTLHFSKDENGEVLLLFDLLPPLLQPLSALLMEVIAEVLEPSTPGLSLLLHLPII